MTFFKIIRDGTVIDAGLVFLKWNEKHRQMFCCEAEEAQFVQSFDQETVYRADWLRPAPEAAGQHETVEVVVITETEFDELRLLLDDGETVMEPAETQEEPQGGGAAEQGGTEEQNRPMTVQEMRQKITEQEEQIAVLTECLLEMSEVVYGE